MIHPSWASPGRQLPPCRTWVNRSSGLHPAPSPHHDLPSEQGGPIHLLRQEQHLSILIAEQNLALALGVADRVYVLERGEVVHEGPAEQFRQARDLQKRYLGV